MTIASIAALEESSRKPSCCWRAANKSGFTAFCGGTGGKFPPESARLVHGQGTPLRADYHPGRYNSMRRRSPRLAAQAASEPAGSWQGRVRPGIAGRSPHGRRIQSTSARHRVRQEGLQAFAAAPGPAARPAGCGRRATISPFDQSIDRRCCVDF